MPGSVSKRHASRNKMPDFVYYTSRYKSLVYMLDSSSKDWLIGMKTVTIPKEQHKVQN